MAILIWSRRQIRDTSGAAVSGGKLRVYTANTTTLASTYSDAAMTVALTNPVVADSLGYLPAIFLSDSTNYDLAELTAGDVVLRTTDDVPAVGSDSTSLVKDFTNARFQVRASGGTVYVEAGDPSPDNTGGTMRLGGWNGTEADLITLDGALVNVDGRLKEGGKKLQGVVYTEATTFTAVASVDIALTNDPTGVRAWQVDLFDVTTSTLPGAVQFTGRFSYDSGATYKAGASDYAYFHSTRLINAATWNGVTDDANTSVVLTGDFNAASNRPMVATMTVWTPNSGSDATIIRSRWDGWGGDTTNVPSQASAVGYGVGAYGRATHLRILVNSGTMTGKYRVVPLRGFGD